MRAKQELLFEKLIDEALRKDDFHALKEFQQNENDSLSHRCSKQLINKLDKLINRELERKEIKYVSLLLNCLHTFGKNITIQGEDGLNTLMKQGLVQKMIPWFEKSREILIEGGRKKNEDLLILFEDVFDVLMILYEVGIDGKNEVLENFLQRTGALVTDYRLNIYIHLEAVRKLNVMLDSIPRETKKRILSSEEMLLVMNDMAKRILDAGDYDLQVGITEALCRMTSEKQRNVLADQWFSMQFVANAFKGIQDCEFETDCRLFLNQVNGILGESRSVYTYPCLKVFFGGHELHMPSDEKLEEFWIDFNAGSQSISFYVSGDEEEDHRWESINIPEDDVEIYNIEDMDGKKLLSITLKHPLNVCSKEESQVVIYFDASLEILDAVRKVYGATKCKGFKKKHDISVVKTTVHIIFDESGSQQILVPESQISPPSKERLPKTEKNVTSTRHDIYPPISPKEQGGNKVDAMRSALTKMATPCKRKVSEASMIISDICGLTRRSPALTARRTSTPRSRHVKPPLEMVNSAERNAKLMNTELHIDCQGKPSKFHKQSVRPEDKTYSASTVQNKQDCKNTDGDRKLKSRARHKGSQRQKLSAAEVIQILHEDDDSVTIHPENLEDATEVIPDSQPVLMKDRPLLLDLTEGSFHENSERKKRQCSTSKTRVSGNAFTERITKHHAFQSIYSSASPSEEARSDKQRKENLELQVKQNLGNLAEEKIGNLSQSKSSESVKNYCRDQEGAKKFNSNHKHDDSEDWPSPQHSKVIEKSVIGYSLKKMTVRKEKGEKVSTNYSCQESSVFRQRSGKIKDTAFCYRDVTKKELKSNPEKKCSVVAKTMIRKISDKYSKRSDDDVAGKNPNIMLNSIDVYNFKLTGSEDPTIKLGAVSHNRKKHLFSDTDTDARNDDSKTEISWLRESNRKPKPKLVDYSRQRTRKKNIHSEKSTPPQETKMEKRKSRKTGHFKQKMETKQDVVAQPNRTRQPRRTAARKANYKDLSNSESESGNESDISLPAATKNSAKLNQGHEKMISLRNVNKSCNNSLKNSKKIATKEPKCDIISRHRSFHDNKWESSWRSQLSPTSIEKVRCSSNSPEVDFAKEHSSVLSSPSPSLHSLTPENKYPVKSAGITVTSLCNLNAGSKKAQYSWSAEASNKKLNEDDMYSPLLSPVTLPALSPLKMNRLVLNGNGDEDLDLDMAKDSDGDNFADISTDKQLSPTVANPVKKDIMEKKTPSLSSSPVSSKRKSLAAAALSNIHTSGPSERNSSALLKHTYVSDIHSDYEELVEDEEEAEEEEKGGLEKGLKQQPRKLFKGDSDIVSTTTGNEFTIMEIDAWETRSESIDTVYEKFSTELTRKFQNRYKKVDYFTQHSLKSVQQHLASVNSKVHEYTIKQLDNFQKRIIEELDSFEKDMQSVKNMEKELANFWKKQSQDLTAYHQAEKNRIWHLKSSFETSIYNTDDCNETIFNSQAHRMKKDMKNVQEKLLKEMQEEELFRVRKGLHMLFVSETTKF